MTVVPKAIGPIFVQTLEKVTLRRILQMKFHQSVCRTVHKNLLKFLIFLGVSV